MERLEKPDFIEEIIIEDLEPLGSIKLVGDLTDMEVVKKLIRECGGFCIYIPQKRNFKEAIKRWLIKTNNVYADPNLVVWAAGMSKDSASKLLKELRGELSDKRQIGMFAETDDQ